MLDLKKLLTKILTQLDNSLDIFYPVGSYYETSDTSFNPNTTWGGTWVLETEGLVHIGAGSTYTVGDTGGSAYIQAHTHSFTQPAYQIAANALTSSGMSANASHAHGTGNDTYTRFLTLNNAITNDSSAALSDGNYKFPRLGSDYAFSTRSATESVSVAHTHTVPSSAYTVPRTTNGAVGAVSGATTGSEGNMQPYVVVNRWHRTA